VAGLLKRSIAQVYQVGYRLPSQDPRP
jgi:hypothetical protein